MILSGNSINISETILRLFDIFPENSRRLFSEMLANIHPFPSQFHQIFKQELLHGLAEAFFRDSFLGFSRNSWKISLGFLYKIMEISSPVLQVCKKNLQEFSEAFSRPLFEIFQESMENSSRNFFGISHLRFRGKLSRDSLHNFSKDSFANSSTNLYCVFLGCYGNFQRDSFNNSG